MKICFAAMICLMTTPAMAQDVFGNPEGCARLAGTGVPNDSAVTFDLEVFEFHESFCTVTTASQVSGGATLLSTTCMGEGAEWDLTFIVETTSDAETLVFYGTDSPENRTEISLCQ